MKKVIISALFLTAFSSGLFAKETIEAPVVEKEVLTSNAIVTPSEDDEYCTNISFQVCGDGWAMTFSGYACAASEGDLYDKIDAAQSDC